LAGRVNDLREARVTGRYWRMARRRPGRRGMIFPGSFVGGPRRERAAAAFNPSSRPGSDGRCINDEWE